MADAFVTSNQGVGERDAWGQWLHSMHSRVSDANWLAYTRESHALITRYVEMGEGQLDEVSSQPPSQQSTQTFQQQPFQQQVYQQQQQPPLPPQPYQQQPMQQALPQPIQQPFQQQQATFALPPPPPPVQKHAPPARVQVHRGRCLYSPGQINHILPGLTLIIAT